MLIEIDDVVRSDVLNELHVFIAVKTRHFITDRFVRSLKKSTTVESSARWSTYVDFHLPVETVVENQIVCHAYAVRFHWMALPRKTATAIVEDKGRGDPLPVVVVADIEIVVVGDFLSAMGTNRCGRRAHLTAGSIQSE